MCFEIQICYHCNENFSYKEKNQSVSCHRCKIRMHNECYQSNKDKALTYTVCPNCNNVGSLGTPTKR